jgi:hypothetical protein
VEGSGNILADALSRIYSNDAPGTVRNSSEYSMFDEDHPPDDIANHGITMPLAVGLEANAVSTRSRTGARPAWVQKPKRTYQRRPKMLHAPDLTVPSPDLVIPFSGDGMKGGEGYTTSSKDVAPPTTVNLAQSLQHEPEETITPNVEAPDRDVVPPEADGSLVTFLSHKMADMDSLDVIRHAYPHDTLLKKVLEHPKDFRNFVKENDLIYLKE